LGGICIYRCGSASAENYFYKTSTAERVNQQANHIAKNKDPTESFS
jgi:hypothetical protein